VSVEQPSRQQQGAVHGRFQPLHNGHLTYIRAARERCSFLWVGLTQFLLSDLREVQGAGTHRSARGDNPLTFHERYCMMRDVLVDDGLPPESFAIVPFPLERPEILNEFIPTTVPMYTTICEAWSTVKIRLLEERGYTIVVLSEGPKEASGQEVRRLIAAGDPSVEDLIPSATSRMVQQLKLWDRLRFYRDL
jgi:cytidyltransferase-like protein